MGMNQAKRRIHVSHIEGFAEFTIEHAGDKPGDQEGEGSDEIELEDSFEVLFH